MLSVSCRIESNISKSQRMLPRGEGFSKVVLPAVLSACCAYHPGVMSAACVCCLHAVNDDALFLPPCVLVLCR